MRPERLLAAAALAVSTAGWSQRPASPAPISVCPSVDACLAELGGLPPRTPLDSVTRRLVGFGDAAVEALIPLLAGENARLRVRAAFALGHFPRIDPKHLPALIAAHRGSDTRGGGWLPRIIGATGSEEGLDHLWGLFLDDPAYASRDQFAEAVAGFGERLRPRLLAAVSRCRIRGDAALCRGVRKIVGEMNPPNPGWAVAPLVALIESDAPRAVREVGIELALWTRHPAGLPVLRRRLEALGSDDEASWRLRSALGDIQKYGPAAAELGPLVAGLLNGPHPDIRAEAAFVLGEIGTTAGTAQLIALEPEYADDWLLAYNAVETLGRWRAAPARPLLERTAQSHWHKGVRDNARRALNALDGGPVALGAESERTARHRLRRGLSAAEAPPMCPGKALRSRSLPQDPPGALPWPSRGAVEAVAEPLGEAANAALHAAIPNLPKALGYSFRLPVRSGTLVGYDHGEFGGTLVSIGADGAIAPVANANVKYAFRMNGRLFVVEGLSHLILSNGSVLVVDEEAMRVVRRIRLPADPHRMLLTADRMLIFETRAGHLAIAEDGRLIDPATLGPTCEG